MAIKVIRGGASLRDARGQVGRIELYAQWGNAGGTFDAAKGLMDTALAAAVAMSNAVVVSWTGAGTPSGASQVLNPFQYGDNQEFPNVEDKARLVFTTDAFGLFAVSIPAPVGTGAGDIFLADGETINQGAATVSAFISAMTADGADGETMSNRSGTPILSYVAGQRQRRRFQRKMTIWQVDPDLSGPEE